MSRMSPRPALPFAMGSALASRVSHHSMSDNCVVRGWSASRRRWPAISSPMAAARGPRQGRRRR
eukprot:3531005-Pyramimonas_sp.AAC.1